VGLVAEQVVARVGVEIGERGADLLRRDDARRRGSASEELISCAAMMLGAESCPTVFIAWRAPESVPSPIRKRNAAPAQAA
jgi:hypothetical protein